MRTTTLLLTLLAVAATPVSAQITEFTAFAGSADCNGWSVDATAYIRDGANLIRLEYVVVLSDADGAEVERFEYSAWMDFTAGQSVVLPLEGTWADTPGAGWSVRGDVLLMDMVPDLVETDERFFEATLDCGTEPGDGVDPDLPVCAYPPLWYRYHPDAWPTDHLEIGGVPCDASVVMQLLKRRNRGLLPVMLARQVVAAKFNLLLNPDSGMEEAVAAADAWLVDHSPFQRFSRRYLRSRAMRQELPVVRALIAPLLRFNFSGCQDVPADKAAATAALDEVDKAFDEVPVAEENVSFGQLKAMYR